jgi:hypothetical protein
MCKDRLRAVKWSKHRPSPHRTVLTTARVGPYHHITTIYVPYIYGGTGTDLPPLYLGLRSYHHTIFKPVKRQLALRCQYCDCGCIQVTIYILDSGSINLDECVCAHVVSVFWAPKARLLGLRVYN